MSRHYSDEQKSIAVAAADVMGVRPAERWLRQEWKQGPAARTLIEWRDNGVEITEAAETYINDAQRQMKTKWQAGIDATRDVLIDATAKAARKGEALKTQQFATATGIFYDKLVPAPRPGAPALIGTASGPVQIIVAQTPNPPETDHRVVPSDYDEAGGARDIGELSAPDDAA